MRSFPGANSTWGVGGWGNNVTMCGESHPVLQKFFHLSIGMHGTHTHTHTPPPPHTHAHTHTQRLLFCLPMRKSDIHHGEPSSALPCLSDMSVCVCHGWLVCVADVCLMCVARVRVCMCV